MSTYIVLLHSDEAAWENADEATRERVRSAHVEFAQRAIGAGHRILGGEELDRSRTATVVRRDGEGRFETSEGPYAEAVEQVGGFYAVETDDPAGLAEIVQVLAWHDGAACEIRPIIDHSMDVDLGARAQAAAGVS
ncbi:YciI family protein [Cellulomonas alba]|uniref:YciI family protein n=1 Tax=Cellulomonas alba TaxID=3053467 RepID=A0ABT7SF82_9CELL|nr:YciI family protein [Cellulomonas alba]MDM7854844.1 YciI family protein [Cellulomonas alba]